MEIGIQVDERTVLRYIKQFKLKIVERNPLKLGHANVAVNLVKALFGKETIEELKEEFQEAKFAAVTDEVHPRVKGSLEEQSSTKRIAEAVNEPPSEEHRHRKKKKQSQESVSQTPTGVMYHCVARHLLNHVSA